MNPDAVTKSGQFFEHLKQHFVYFMIDTSLKMFFLFLFIPSEYSFIHSISLYYYSVIIPVVLDNVAIFTINSEL